MRKRTMKKIREQGGPNCKLFWADLKGGQRKKRNIPRMKTRCGKVVDELSREFWSWKFWSAGPKFSLEHTEKFWVV